MLTEKKINEISWLIVLMATLAISKATELLTICFFDNQI